MQLQTKKGESVSVSFNFASELGGKPDNYVFMHDDSINCTHQPTGGGAKANITPSQTGKYEVTCQAYKNNIQAQNSITIEVSD